jgi:small-conductance mechanosensitive channel
MDRGIVFALGLGDKAARTVDTLYHAQIAIGSTSIELTGVWAGLAVLLATFVLVKVVAPLLQWEIVPRLSSKPGLPLAVATVTRYLLVTAGTLLGIAAMGIDLTKSRSLPARSAWASASACRAWSTTSCRD